MSETTNKTTIEIIASDDGKSYSLEIVEEEAKKGTRIDQRTAQAILAMDERLRNPQVIQAMQQYQSQNAMYGDMMNARRMMPMQGFPLMNEMYR